MSDSVVIPHHSLLECLQTIQRLKLVLGRDCQFDESFDLRIPLQTVDRLLEDGLNQPDLTSPVKTLLTTTAERIDRVIDLIPDLQLKALQISNQFQADWAAAGDDRGMERLARRRQLEAQRELRLEAIAPYVMADIVYGSTLLYGLRFEGVIPLQYPDGKAYVVKSLIHQSHPATPEDLYLREVRAVAEKIYRYRVPGLDDGDWFRQNEPRSTLDAQGWRKLLAARIMTGL
jgi:hypothetical protein